MSKPHICPQCGAPLPADAPDELCPKCLLQMGFESQAGPRTGPSHRSTQYQPRYLPPGIEELAVKFPQLELLERIGQGGMGVVYKARQKDLDRVVALKILRPDIETDPAFSERFVREARALAKLSHPAIVTVHDFGSIDGFYYFIMEYIDGANLRELEQAGQLESRQALAIVPQICEALQYAHDQGLVHRDIKPENILIDRQGRVKIADFGLAKMVGVVPDAATLTGAWQVLGTPHYMAPEQMQGLRSVDHRADIYSLGVVIYEMLTGELPLGRFPLPSQKVQVDVRLDEVVLRALEHEPGRRYQQVNQIKTDMETIGGHPSQEQKVSTKADREISWWDEFSEMLGLVVKVGLIFMLILLGLWLTGVGGTAFHEQAADTLKLGSEVRANWVLTLQITGGLVILAGAAMLIGWYTTTFVLIGIGMWHFESSWVLAGLGVPWCALGWQVLKSMRAEKAGGRENVGVGLGITGQVVLSFLVTVGLVIYGIFLSQSAWPLLSVISVLIGVYAAEWVGSLKWPHADRVTGDHPGFLENAHGTLASVFGYRSRAVDESTDRVHNPAATPRRPFSVTLLGLACLSIGLWNLFLAALTLALPGASENDLDELIRERPGLRNWHAVHLAAESWLEFPLAYVLLGAGVGLLLLRPWGRWLALGWAVVALILGLALMPVMFAGIAVMMMQSPALASEAELEPMMLIGAFLGAVIVVALEVVFPIIVLLVLNRPRVKQTFATRVGNGEVALGEVAESRGVLVACWNYCVQRQPGPTRIVLLLVYLGAFILFFSMEGKMFRPDDGPPTNRVETKIGVPFPWFEHWAQKDVGGQTRINLFTPTWLIAIAAFVALRLALDVRPENTSISVLELPEIHMMIWFLIGLAGVLRVFVESALTAEPKPHYYAASAMIGTWLALALCGIGLARRTNRILRSEGTSGS